MRKPRAHSGETEGSPASWVSLLDEAGNCCCRAATMSGLLQQCAPSGRSEVMESLLAARAGEMISAELDRLEEILARLAELRHAGR